MAQEVTANKARLVVDDAFEVAPVNNRLFGSFVDILGVAFIPASMSPVIPRPMKMVSVRM